MSALNGLTTVVAVQSWICFYRKISFRSSSSYRKICRPWRMLSFRRRLSYLCSTCHLHRSRTCLLWRRKIFCRSSFWSRRASCSCSTYRLHRSRTCHPWRKRTFYRRISFCSTCHLHHSRTFPLWHGCDQRLCRGRGRRRSHKGRRWGHNPHRLQCR